MCFRRFANIRADIGMNSTVSQVIALILDEPVAPGLWRAAELNVWPTLRPVNVRDAMMEVFCRKPSVVATQFSIQDAAALRMISVLRSRRNLPVLVVASAHSDALEQAARAAGASTYLPDDASCDQVVQSVRTLLHARDAPRAFRQYEHRRAPQRLARET